MSRVYANSGAAGCGARPGSLARGPGPLLLTVLLVLGLAVPAWSAEPDLDFSIPEAESKFFEFGGYLEGKETVLGLNKDSLLYRQKYAGQHTADTQFVSGLGGKLEGKAQTGIATAYARFRLDGQKDVAEGWTWANTFEEAYLSLKPAHSVTLEAGKRVMKWGKGYAWNPVGFVSRPKNPDEPEETLEGYGMLNADLIKSFDGPLQTLAFTPVVIPVTEFGNSEWGRGGAVAYGAKLYALFKDTDIDLMLLTGESTSTRAGMDFSRNVTTEFEVHGEAAMNFDTTRTISDSQGNLRTEHLDAASYLLGMRYLNSYDATFIFEYYHNGLGYSRSEASDYFDFVRNALAAFAGGDPSKLKKSRSFSQTYMTQNYGRDYLYLRVSQKEPFDILYLTPALTGMLNLNDQSFSLAPEITYSPTTNMEFRLKSTFTFGASASEYGEKINGSKTELRLRYYF
jgi:hypothetical protein